MAIRVLIADDHKLFRQGLISLMSTREGWVTVVGQASTGSEAVRLADSLRPQVVLMDIYMPEMDGLQALQAIRAAHPEITVVMLTSSESDEHVFRALELGASGYLLKDLDAGELFDAIDGVVRGEAAMTKAMAARLIREIAHRSAEPQEGQEALSERELAVLRLVATGASNAEIAEQLSVSVNTVKSHIRNILDKLQLENRTQAARYAMNRGLVPPVDKTSS